MSKHWKQLFSTAALTGLLGSAACLGSAPTSSTGEFPRTPTTPLVPGDTPPIPTAPNDPLNPTNTGSAEPEDNFSHMDESNVDPFDVLARLQEEGPPEVSTRMHSCGKMRYATLGNVLRDLGVTMTGAGMTPNGLYTTGASALGRPDYANRTAETTEVSTSGSVRLYDIFVAAAPEIITAMPNNVRCRVAGAPTSMFDPNGCTANGIACLTGATPSQAQKDLCDSAQASNTTKRVGTGATAPTVGQVVAVASLLSAAHSCE